MTQCRTTSAIIEENATRNTCANQPRVGTNIRTTTRRLTRHFGIRLRFNVIATAVTALATWSGSLQAQSIFVPNYSFESPTAPMTLPFVNTSVDSWEKPTEPAYYDAAIGTPYGIPWEGTAGVFFDVNPYANHIGSQVGYLLDFPQVALFQDYNSTPTHDFDATFEVGSAYTLTVGIFGKDRLAPGSTLRMSLYYRDGSNNKMIVGSQSIIYSMMTFPTNTPLNLVDFAVNVPVVQAGDAWAGQHIGIQLESTSPLQQASGGNWDFDNVRLTAVPEPSSLSLLGLGFGGLLLGRARLRRL